MIRICYFVVADAEPTPVGIQTAVTTTTPIVSSTISKIPIVNSTISTIPTTNTLTTTSSTCSSSSSFRCQLPAQPTCGGCLNYQPCSTQGYLFHSLIDHLYFLHSRHTTMYSIYL